MLKQGLEILKIVPTEQQFKILELYIRELKFWNPKYNLVKYDTEEELIIKHILDSLSALEYMKNSGVKTLADVGSGGGLPGFLLAIFLPEIEFYLIERQTKRVKFLESLVFLSKISNVKIINQDVREVKTSFDALTFRAFTGLNSELFALSFKLAPKVFAYKGKLETLSEELKNLNVDYETLSLKVPFLVAERNLVILNRKI